MLEISAVLLPFIQMSVDFGGQTPYVTLYLVCEAAQHQIFYSVYSFSVSSLESFQC